MPELARAVLDASAYLAALKGNREAIEVLRAAVYGKIHLHVPAHFHTEVANALRTAVERGLMQRPDAETSLAAAVRMKLSVEQDSSLLLDALALALDSKTSVYDAAYAVLAQHHQADLITADHGLAQMARSRGIASNLLSVEAN